MHIKILGRLCECTSVRQEACGQREVRSGKGRVNCSHSWFLPEETETVAITSCRAFKFPSNTRPYTEGEKNTHSPEFSLFTLHYMHNMSNRPLFPVIKVLRPYQSERDRENMRVDEREIEREGGK